VAECKDCKVEPFQVPDGCDVVPACELRFTDGERLLFDSVAEETTNIPGVEVEFYSQQVGRATRDPLYDEPIERVWKGPYKITVYVAWPTQTPEAREEGLLKSFDGTAWGPRITFEKANAPYPKEGDVIRFWKLPYFDKVSVLDDIHDHNTPRAGLYFDVTMADDDGHLFDTEAFVGFKMTLRRSTEFTAERRITPP